MTNPKVKEDAPDVTSYTKEEFGYAIRRNGKQYGAAIGEHAVMAQFLGIDPNQNEAEFKETFVAPTPRPTDHFPLHFRAAKYGFGKAK